MLTVGFWWGLLYSPDFWIREPNILMFLERSWSKFFFSFLWGNGEHLAVVPMAGWNNVKKYYIRLFSWMLNRFLQKMCFQSNELIKPNETVHLGYLFTCRVQHWTISAFTVLDLFGLSRSHRLQKHISVESMIPFPNS